MTALAVPAVPAPGMGTSLEGLSSQPINSRRPAAPTLPSFELPPPPFGLASTALKYQSQPPHTSQPPISHAPTNVSVGNLLTPPATNQSADHGSVSHSLPPSSGVASEISPAYWPGTTPYGAPGGGPGQWAPPANAIYSGRSSFSPSSLHRSGSVTSPPTTDGLSQPYEAPPMASFSQALPAPSTSTLASGPHPVTLGLYQPNHAASATSLPSNDPYNSKVHSMYASPGQHTGYSPLYAGPNPLGGHGHPGMHPGARMPLQSPGGQPPVPYPRQPWPSYSLPAMSGPVMSNVHSPNSPLSMMGGMPSGVLPGFNSGHLANTQHLYGAHSAPHHGMPGPVADRPFKCDQCPQSFNRNHDLKRHKRIHLAVKPFPCAHCDKSFSRKDALKRHILVKGCGTGTASDSNGALTGENGTLKTDGSGDELSPLANGRN
ncbi:Zinc finger C2H2 type domain-containing protein [Penicillium ucsense]|uniref:Zinc finger C2H2 type domain-containing protein n=1 Tax=Penicillium ucsense TaxID=2839758 RepID=A0A8J8WDB5_9EURO|nr:Zinc finger C2H2 type domain-containing protein [Penicillium ucsense]KAF7726831.1 Zinc finger C2H2 type domain-containing protein [Penicillium ucsense]